MKIMNIEHPTSNIEHRMKTETENYGHLSPALSPKGGEGE
jgi:hypothetical protein